MSDRLERDKRVIIRFLLLATVTLMSGSELLAQKEAVGPTIRRAVSQFDFGFVPDRATVSHKFWYVNESPDSAVIERVQSGCGCITIPEYQKNLGPGDSTQIEIEFNTGRFINYVFKKTRVTTLNKTTEQRRIDLLTVSAFVLEDSSLAVWAPAYFSPPRVKLRHDSAPDSLLLQLEPADSAFNWEIVEYPDEIPAEIAGPSALLLRPKLAGVEGVLRRSVTVSVNSDSTFRVTIPISSR